MGYKLQYPGVSARNCSMETSVPTASADGHTDSPVGFAPPLGNSVPER
jgi:hypothetical protein